MIGITKSFSWCAAVPGMRRHGAAPIDFVGGGGRDDRKHLLHLAFVFAALLILTPRPASAANECGTATGTPPTVTCDADDTFGTSTNGFLYTVGHGTNGLTLTVEEGVHVTGNQAFGLQVNATGNLTAGSKVDITSRGDYSVGNSGVYVQVTGSSSAGNRAAVPVTLNVPKGLFKVRGSDYGAVEISSQENNKSDIEFNFNGQVQGAHAKSIGVKLFEQYNSGGTADEPLESKVTLQSEARVGGNVGYGVKIHSANANAEFNKVFSLTIEKGAGIGTLAQPVKKDGVIVWIENPRGEGTHKQDVVLTHTGQLYATGHGIWVDHRWKDWALLDAQKTKFEGGKREKVAVTVAEGGLVVAGDGKHGIFISTHQFPDPGAAVSNDATVLTAIKIGKPLLFAASDADDKKLIDMKAAIPGMYNQQVIVDGVVKGGKNGAAVHLMGGGTITLGAKGRLEPTGATGRSVEVSQAANEDNKPDLLILLNGNFQGIQKIKSVTDRTGSATDKTRFRYRLLGGETTYTDLKNGDKITLVLGKMPAGFYNDWKTQVELTADITKPVDNVFSLNFKSKLAQLTAPDGQRQVAKRGNVYQSLPSVLWDLSDGMERYVPAANASVERNGEAMQSAADGAGGTAGWVRLEGGSGDRRLKKSLAEAVSYRLSSTGFAVGADLPGDGGLTYRAGLHHRQGRAKVTGGGQVKASGLGAGFGVSKRQANGWVLDGWLGATQYDDIQVQSSETIAGQATPFTVNAKTKGTSYALGVGAATELALGNATVTQRGSLAWTSVSMKDFKTTYTSRADEDEAGNSLNAMTTTVAETIAMKDGSGLQGGYGVRIDTRYGAGDCCGLFGSLDLRHDFNAKRSVSVSSDLRSDTVSTENRPTSLRLGFGGSKSWNEGQATLSGAIYHTTAGHGNSSLSGGVALAFRF